MNEFMTDEAGSLGFINHASTIPLAKQALETFSKFLAGHAIDYHRALFQLTTACNQLQALQEQDQELLNELASSVQMSPEFKAAFDALVSVLAGSAEHLGREGELVKTVLVPFTSAVEAFAGSELDPLATNEFTAPAYEGQTLTEPSKEERMLREFLAQLTLLSRSTLLFKQCSSALAVVQALLQKSPSPEKIKSAGSEYIFELARLRGLIMLEPMLTVMVGREQFRI
ncbi:MAG: hypothetical protein SFV17_08760 [Candidatus Obscuribacter sp.]|nr:hypothetical protein [Candidatus Obscuribacter sp.]